MRGYKPERTLFMTKEEIRIKELLITSFGLCCWGCEVEIGDGKLLILDHIVPENEGGADTIENRALLCNSCNSKKSDRYTISELRSMNKVKNHRVGLKRAMAFIREKRQEDILAKHNQLALNLPLTTIPAPSAAELEKATPEFDNIVTGMKQTRQLLWIRGHTELAEALGEVVLIRGYCFGGPCEFHLHMNREASEQFNYILKIPSESRYALLEALCDSYSANVKGSWYSVYLDTRPLAGIVSSVTPLCPRALQGEYHDWQSPSE